MKSAWRIIRNSKFIILVLALAALVGILYIAPSLAIRRNFINEGQRFVLAQFKTYRNSLYHYLPRAREIYDGHFPPSDVSAAVDGPTVANLLPPKIFSIYLNSFHGSINRAYLTAQLKFPALIFALFVLIGWLFTKSKIWSVFSGLVGVLTPIPLKLPFYDWSGWNDFAAFFLKNFIPLVQTQFDKLPFHLIDNPLMTTPFLLGAVAATYWFWTKPSKISVVAAAIISSTLFYVYFHFWVYWVIVLGLVTGYSLLVTRERPGRWKLLILFWAMLIVFALPYFINYWNFSRLPNVEDYTFRLGIAQGRFFTTQVWPDYLVYAGLIALVIWLYRKTDQLKAIFLTALLAAFYIAWNVQLVIGYVPVPHTWYKVASPILFIVLGAVIFELLNRLAHKQRLQKVLLVTLIASSAVLVIKKIANPIAIYRNQQQFLWDYYKFDNGIAKSWDWINENLPAEPLLITPSVMNALYLTTYTSARPYLPAGFTSTAPMEELEKRYLESHKLFGISPKNFENRLYGTYPKTCSGFDCFPDEGSNQNDSIWHLYGNYFTSKYGTYKEFMSGGDKSAVKEARARRMAKLSQDYLKLKTNWADITADYVYFGPWEKQLGGIDLSSDPGLRLVYKNEGVLIYKILRTNN